MSYKLEKPFTEEERCNFLVEHNYNHSRDIKETDDCLYALEPNEIMKDGVPIVDPNYEEEKAQEEAKHIAELHITKGDMNRALVNAFYLTLNDILEKAKIEQPDTWKFIEAELSAGEIYRGNPYVDSIGANLGVTPKQLDNFFIKATDLDRDIKINAWKELLPQENK